MAIRNLPAACCALLFAAFAAQPAFAVRLNSMSIQTAQLTPAFQGSRSNYTAAVAAEVTQVRIVAVPAGFRSTLTVNGLATSPGTPSAPVALAQGQNTIRVASTGRATWWSPITTDTYTIVITRAGNNAPVVGPLSVSGPEVEQGTPVTFSGTASDAEEGNLSAALRWSSNRDGTLGTGASLTRTLSVGSHTLTATVTDGGGASASGSIGVIVVPGGGGSQRPNILFILADDLGSEASILYPELSGNSGQVPTPNIQSLAERGIVFTNAWANPVCSPTRAAWISGKYGNRSGVTNVGQTLSPATNTPIFRYVAQASPASYGIGVFGKWHIGPNAQHVRDSGVLAFRGIISGGISNYFNWSYTDINGAVTSTTTYSTTALTDFAIDYIRAHRESSSDPWFVYLPYNAPHGTGASTGFQVPPANLHSVDVGGLAPGTIRDTVPVYKAMIQAMDTEIGRLLNAIGPVGSPERDNTIIIFMGDNGTPAAVKDPGARLRGSKSGIYEGGIRVPLVVSGAGVTRQGVRDDSLVVDTDLYATIAAVSGIPVSQIENSHSLVPLFTDAGGSTGRSYSLSEMCTSQAYFALRDARYKLSFSAGVWGLYDLATDPMESTNRFNDATLAAKRSELQAELAVLRQNATSGCLR
jgi:arylsulfatase A-like enzyme